MKFYVYVCLLSFILASCTKQEHIEGKVVGVHDGDTLTVLVDNRMHKIRIKAIDAPELGQDFGKVAKKELSDLCFGQQATARVFEQDRYNRDVASVRCQGHDASEWMVKEGLAWAYTKYGTAKENQVLGALQESARLKRIGIWSQDAIAPWEWRKAKKNST